MRCNTFLPLSNLENNEDSIIKAFGDQLRKKTTHFLKLSHSRQVFNTLLPNTNFAICVDENSIAKLFEFL